MVQKYYLFIATLLFGLLSVPSLMNLLFDTEVFLNSQNKNAIQMALFLFVLVVETLTIRSLIFKIMGFILTVFLVLALLIQIMHWPFGKEIFVLSGIGIICNLILAAFMDKNKILFNYAMFVFLLFVVSTKMMQQTELLWWVQLILQFVFTLIGLNSLRMVLIEKQ